MWKYKQFFLGAVVSAVVITGSTALAASSDIPSISNLVKFKFNDVEKKLPNGYTVLTYQDHTYVPARFIAEELGATVEWNNTTQTVHIIKNEEENTPTNTPINEQKPVINYEALPVSQTQDGVRVEVYSVSQDSNLTTIYLRVKNTTKNPIKIDQESAYMQIDDEQFKNISVDHNYYSKDQTWFDDIREDETREGYIKLPRIDKEYNEGTFIVKLVQNDYSQKELEYKFNIDWK